VSDDENHRLFRAIAALTYKSDTITEYKDGIIVGLPQAEKGEARHEARVFVGQLGKILNIMKIEASLMVGIAIFREEGQVADKLVEIALNNASLIKTSDLSTYPNPKASENERVGELILQVQNEQRSQGAPSSVQQISVSEPQTEAFDFRHGDLVIELDKRIEIEEGSKWVKQMRMHTPESRKTYQVLKRFIDVVIILPIVIPATPVMFLVALSIWLDDRHGVFYMQPRTGYNGDRFGMYKFRTMKVGAPSVAAQTVTMPDGTLRYVWPEKNDRDPRITRVGRILRKTSLDELPQLLNILKGDMSLVGPRPTSWSLEKYTEMQTGRLAVRPGITGLWQVSARDATNFDERLKWDQIYIEKASLWLDLLIALRTVLGVFQKSGV
jgi:lipopolysaccharide/colanic/teichoic acid biosynthesis glycosyltransferase